MYTIYLEETILLKPKYTDINVYFQRSGLVTLISLR